MKRNKNFRCLDCDHEQQAGSFCQSCCSTNIVTFGNDIPANGTIVKYMASTHSALYFMSLGECDKRGRLRVALIDEPGEYWGSIVNWKAV